MWNKGALGDSDTTVQNLTPPSFDNIETPRNKILIIHQYHQMLILKIILLLHETVTYPNLNVYLMAILIPET